MINGANPNSMPTQGQCMSGGSPLYLRQGAGVTTAPEWCFEKTWRLPITRNVQQTLSAHTLHRYGQITPAPAIKCARDGCRVYSVLPAPQLRTMAQRIRKRARGSP